MTRRICSMALALLLLAWTIPQAAAASGPFAPVRTYEDQFTDVSPADWFYENVKALYELGLTNGQGAADRFAPGDNMTLAEAVTLSARLRSLYEYGDSEEGPGLYAGDSWYEPYAAYLKALGVIGTEFDGAWQREATRAEMAHLLANALPQSLFEDINGEAVTVGYASRNYILDVNDYTPYREDILALYRWGILSGMDRTGSFHPDEAIERSQVAAMVTRLVDEDLRVRLDWDLSLAYSRVGTTLESLVDSDGTFHTAPGAGDQKAIDDNIRYMLSRGERRMVLSYGPDALNEAAVSALLEAFLAGIRRYAEQGYNAAQCSYSARTGSLVLTFSSSLYDERLLDSYRDAAMEAAIQVHDQLWSDGTVTASMSEYDKARAYFTWLCQHCQYDFASTDTSLSHSGYGAFINGLAVCDGYTAAYNLLLKLEGIDCTTMSTTDHIWTVATLDGTQYHIDPTWGDQTGTIAYRYFAMTEAASLARFAS